MERFLFIYRGGAPQTPDLSPSAVQAHLKKWEGWVAALTQAGHFEAGEALTDAARVVRRGGLVVDGPFAESKEAVGGYAIIRARDLDDAERIAAKCPIFEFEGSVEVRALAPGMCLDTETA